MFENCGTTQYITTERTDQSELERQSEIFCQNKLLINFVNSLSQMLVVLNKQRQVIYANKLYYKFCGVPENKSLLGMRPGETINCIHAFQTQRGCGTTEFCKTCGAANAIAESHKRIQSTKECQILTKTYELKDIQVTATPYDFEGETFTIYALIDISNKKRKETLERVFFHDILNSAGGISGLSAILKEIKAPCEILNITKTINHAAENLVEEIQMQHQLNEAEHGELKPTIKKVSSLSILNELKELYAQHELFADKTIFIDKNSENIILNTDPVLLRRVLGNMLKNALEVYNPNAQITLRCQANNQSVQFSVHNSSFIERNVQLQLFKCSFSTKGIGRGVGTYSMKLLGEKYLKGKVWFESTKEKGTIFYIEI